MIIRAALCARGMCTSGNKVVVPSGLVAVHKPMDWTSSDVVNKVKNILRRHAGDILARRVKLKVGHGGTLDPLAEGVLVLGVGQGTKLMTEFLSGGKCYHATALLGYETNTLDCTGNITRAVDSGHVDRALLESKLPTFTGDIMQIPPMFSALKKDGKRLYDIARAGEEVLREPRAVTVHRLAMRGDVTDTGTFQLDIESGGGFYVRSLIEDLARTCDAAAHMTALVRTKQGPFTLEDCIPEGEWTYEGLVAGLERCNKKAGLTDLKPALAFN